MVGVVASGVGRDVGAVSAKARTGQLFRGNEDSWVAAERVLHGDGSIGTNNELFAREETTPVRKRGARK